MHLIFIPVINYGSKKLNNYYFYGNIMNNLIKINTSITFFFVLFKILIINTYGCTNSLKLGH